MLEAMASGKPVVAFRIAPLTEFVEDGGNGRLVQPYDAHALAGAVCEIARDREGARRMGERGQEIVRQRFRIEDQVRVLERVYVSVIGEASRSPGMGPDGALSVRR
ncbi:MAG: hypothetical protein C4289_02900 [Chloroflexota bacterium]